jgi:hypothetical protein
MDTKDVITIIVAIYGAALSTFNFLIAYLERRRRVTVKLTRGIIGTVPEPTNTFILTAANPGHRLVTLSGCSLLLPNRQQLIMLGAAGSVQFPCDLKEGQSCAVYFPLIEVVEAMLKEGFSGRIALKAVFRDALGNNYESEPFDGNLQEWAKIR